MDGVLRAARAWERELRDLLLPRGCAGCDRPDETLCADCRALFLTGRAWTLRRDGIAVPCFACADYRGAARNAVLAWKDHDDVELDADFADAMRALGAAACGSVVGAVDVDAVVPVPSSAASRRRRGRAHVRPLAKGVAAGLKPCGAGTGPRIADVLRIGGAGAKSVAVGGVRGRAHRLDDRVRVAGGGRGSETLRGRRVALVDDIVTTGATLAHCALAVRAAGGVVVAAFALARTPAPGECGPTLSGISAG
ncbi:ComF family protein [Bifidobacterium avesanii]|uniref:ComF family protein n=1 Tax=Bifidobacterium avesanii TaxID=1798157 RepID=A0A7K3TGX4_9BIFI|nr:ComF family protein [Bifidobacterium avesanii]KAB8292739.1 phosphoribosyl transferase [Bifidobacterium avesanii]NEG78347.1 ComF family protein [Bifidobacterium avesanii]